MSQLSRLNSDLSQSRFAVNFVTQVIQLAMLRKGPPPALRCHSRQSARTIPRAVAEGKQPAARCMHQHLLLYQESSEPSRPREPGL